MRIPRESLGPIRLTRLKFLEIGLGCNMPSHERWATAEGCHSLFGIKCFLVSHHFDHLHLSSLPLPSTFYPVRRGDGVGVSVAFWRHYLPRAELWYCYTGVEPVICSP